MRICHIPIGVLLLASALAAGDTKPAPPPKPPPPPKPQAAPRAQAPGRSGAGGPAQHPVNPVPPRPIDDQIEKLAQMSPAQRETALSILTPNQRTRLENGLDNWNKLTPQQKAQRLAQHAKFRSLSPEAQNRIRELSDRIKALPVERKIAVQQEIAKMRRMPPAQRQKFLNSPEVKKDFSPQEQEIIRDSPNLLPQNYF